ncbi:MAG: hypothetical protein B0W54_16365 [Cellvibrio sp. 79]|nr:MAG: hypothetical protein B0W54_16365 [Cellvibrio sp. 79]
MLSMRIVGRDCHGCFIHAGLGAEPVIGVGEWKALVARQGIGGLRCLWLRFIRVRVLLWVSGSYMSPVHWDYLCDG